MQRISIFRAIARFSPFQEKSKTHSQICSWEKMRFSRSSAFLCFIAIVAFSLSGFASMSDLVFTVTRKKLEEKKAASSMGSSRTKDIIYSIKMLNKGFREYENVVIKYNIYYEVPLFGSSNEPELRTANGIETLPVLPCNKPIEFATAPITLTSESLHANSYFANGSKRDVKDKVVGVWFKAFDAEGTLIGEYSNPSTVTRKYKWQE